MARIAGIDMPKDKRVEIGLTYIYGIGLFCAAWRWGLIRLPFPFWRR